MLSISEIIEEGLLLLDKMYDKSTPDASYWKNVRNQLITDYIAKGDDRDTAARRADRVLAMTAWSRHELGEI